MAFFKNINSLAELKKQYRALAFKNHPDVGGSTQIMQQINAEFERLYDKWKDVISTSSTYTGYESDYEGATARQYANYVYNEYRWKGHNYHGQSNAEIIDNIRKWLKETYPTCKFSVRRDNYNSFYVFLMKGDFNPFKYGTPTVRHEINHYWIDNDNKINDHAKEMMKNIIDYILSFRYDKSNPMIDYFDTNFYLTIGIGTYKNPFEITYAKLKGTSKAPKKEKVAAEIKVIKSAMGTSIFANYKAKTFEKVLLGDYYYCENGEKHFWPKHYSGYGQAVKRLNKLREAGIKCKMFRNYIEFDGFDETIDKNIIDKLNIVEL